MNKIVENMAKKEIKTKKEITEFLKHQLESTGYSEDVFDLDSLEKVELVMNCEDEFGVAIDEDDISQNWGTDEFVDYLYKKINNKL